MQVNISGHQLVVTDALRDYVAEKLSRLERHFDRITNVQVIMEVEKLKQKIEATVRDQLERRLGGGSKDEKKGGGGLGDTLKGLFGR